jgi:isopentenyl phosphate kinase
MDLVFLKLGGSAITDKTRGATPRPEVIRGGARAVQRARIQNPNLRILLGHGSGSFGHFAAKKYGFGRPITGETEASDRWQAYAETGAAAQRLNRIVTDIFLEEGVPVVSSQPSASALCREGELQSLAAKPIQSALEHDLVPLVYGDVAFDETRGMSIVSTEQIFTFLVTVLRPKRIVYATAVNGIYSGDPYTNPQAELIPEITPSSFPEIRAGVGDATGYDMTGGMLDKVERALALVEQVPQLEVYIIGAEQGLIERALLQDNFAEGTWIHRGAIAGD